MSYINSCTANFDNLDLPTAISGLNILGCDAFKPAKRNVSSYGVARTDKFKIDSAFYGMKTINVRANIVAATRDLAEAQFDALEGILQGKEKNLILRQSGTTRRYIATLVDIVWVVSGGSYLEFTLVFSCSDAFGYDVNQTLLLQVLNFTSGNKTDSFTVGGSARSQPPVITYTVNSLTGGTSATVRFGNDTTGQQIVITRTFAAGEVMEIDSLNQTVKINGTEIAPTSGAFPEWAKGLGYLSYSDTFTARNVSYNVKHNRRYV